jgi:hypothetical protein
VVLLNCLEFEGLDGIGARLFDGLVVAHVVDSDQVLLVRGLASFWYEAEKPLVALLAGDGLDGANHLEVIWIESDPMNRHVTIADGLARSAYYDLHAFPRHTPRAAHLLPARIQSPHDIFPTVPDLQRNSSCSSESTLE